MIIYVHKQIPLSEILQSDKVFVQGTFLARNERLSLWNLSQYRWNRHIRCRYSTTNGFFFFMCSGGKNKLFNDCF